VPGPEKLKEMKRIEEISEMVFLKRWELGEVIDKLHEFGVTDETLNVLGLEGTLALMTEASAETVKELVTSREELEKAIKEALANPEVKTMIEFRMQNWYEAMEEWHKIKKEKRNLIKNLREHLGQNPNEARFAEYEIKLEELQAKIKELSGREQTADIKNEIIKTRLQAGVIESGLKRIKEPKKELTIQERMVIAKTKEKMNELDIKTEELRQSSPEAFLGLGMSDFLRYKKSLDQKGLAETPFVKRHLEELETHSRAGIPTLIYGHFGSGKTELAIHFAKTRIPLTDEQKERGVPSSYIISGSRHIVPAELYGHQVLTIPDLESLKKSGGFTDEQLKLYEKQANQIETSQKEWEKEHPDATDEEKSRHHQTLLQLTCAQMGKGTISDFVLGPVYEAMKEGRPLIIDEVNAIPHEVLISLNYILTRKPGEEITVQQDTGMKVKIKKGFCVLLTGNLNQGQRQYVDRMEFDPAFLSRLHRIEYDYLPQEKQGSFEDKRGAKNELYQLILTKMMDKRGNIVAPKGTFRRLWKLAQAARLLQDVFAGREVESAYYYQEAGGKNVQYMLQKSTLSLREVGKILDFWKEDNFRYELDYYLYKEFVGEAVDLNDRAYLYQILKDQFGFFKSKGWEQNPNYGSAGQIFSFDIEPAKNLSEELEFNGPREVVEAGFGNIPERKIWPKLGGKGKKEMAGAEEMIRRVGKVNEGIEVLKKKIPKKVAEKLG